MLRVKGKRAIKGYICFPTGRLGENLSKPSSIHFESQLDTS